MLSNASTEQQKVVDAIEKNNVVVNSVAGSGKTTTILHICKKYSSAKILVLTYNKLLKEETREKAEKLKLDNVEIHSFHAAAVKYLHHDCHTDLMLLKHLNARLNEIEPEEDSPTDEPPWSNSSSDEEEVAAENKPNNLHLLEKLAKMQSAQSVQSATTTQSANMTQSTNSLQNSPNALNGAKATSQTKQTLKPKFDIIVIDECQDMTHLYYRFICYLIREAWDGCDDSKRICVLGDVKQCIYEFKEADDRFLTLAPKVFNFNSVPWVQLQLTESFRINSHMANFITNCLLSAELAPTSTQMMPQLTTSKDSLLKGEQTSPQIVSRKVGPKVTYLIYDPFKHLHTYIAGLIHKRLNAPSQAKLTPNDIFILAPSVKISNAKNPLKLLANKLTSYGYTIFMPNNDDEKLNENEILNKITFCTYHQAKGRERRLVLVMNFENNLFAMHNFKHHDSRILPNEIYVACTRATEELLLLQNCKSLPFKFLNLDLRGFCAGSRPRSAKVSTFQTETLAKKDTADFLDVYCFGKYDPVAKKEQPEEYQIVTELIRFLSSELVSELELMYEKREINPAKKDPILLNKSIGGESHSPNKNLIFGCESHSHNKNGVFVGSATGSRPFAAKYIENVSAINGIAIPAFYELVKRGSMSINAELTKRVIGGKIKIFGKNYDCVLRGVNTSQQQTDDDKKQHLVENILYKSTLFSAFKSGLLFKLEQIKRYDWLTYGDFTRCFENFNKHAGKYEFKHEVFAQKVDREVTKTPIVITGFIDAIDQYGDLWEFKCTSELQPEHFLQIILYFYIRGGMQHPTLDKDCDGSDPLEYVTRVHKLYVFNVLNEHLYEVYVNYKQAREIYLKIMIFRESKDKSTEHVFLDRIARASKILTVV